MGCFLTMTGRDLTYLRHALKAGVSVVGSTGGGQVKVQVSAVGQRSARQMAALIRNEAQSARVATGSPDEFALPMKERLHYELNKKYGETPWPVDAILKAVTEDKSYTQEAIIFGKGEAQVIAAAFLKKQGYLAQIDNITESTGPDIQGTSKGGTRVFVEVKSSGIDSKFGSRMETGVYKEIIPGGMRQNSDDWLRHTTKGADPSKAIVYGVEVDTYRQRLILYRRIDSEARDWKQLAKVPLSSIDLSQFE